jgi:tetratricopeptide (TPR) repeat protein
MNCASPSTIAIKLNNAGVELLKGSNYKDATASFTAALTKIQELLVDEDVLMCCEETQDATIDNDSDQNMVLDSESEFTKTHCLSFALPLESGESILSDPNHRSIFCQPILLSSKQATSSVEACNMASFAIMFNLAMTYHLNGMESVATRQGKLRKALRLYEFAYSVQMQESIQLQITYTLGMVNNLGHIHEILGDNQKAQQCFQHLLSTLMYMTESGANFGCQWDIFYHNVTQLVLREPAFAAAA